MFGRPDRMRYDAMPAVIYTHPEVAMVGRTEEELKAAPDRYRKAVVPMAVAGRFLIENVKETGLVKVLAGAEHGEILGVHAIGDLSSEFIVAAGAMIETELPAPAGQPRSSSRTRPWPRRCGRRSSRHQWEGSYDRRPC